LFLENKVHEDETLKVNLILLHCLLSRDMKNYKKFFVTFKTEYVHDNDDFNESIMKASKSLHKNALGIMWSAKYSYDIITNKYDEKTIPGIFTDIYKEIFENRELGKEDKMTPDEVSLNKFGLFKYLVSKAFTDDDTLTTNVDKKDLYKSYYKPLNTYGGAKKTRRQRIIKKLKQTKKLHFHKKNAKSEKNISSSTSVSTSRRHKTRRRKSTRSDE
jgi:hypothetical protein